MIKCLKARKAHSAIVAICTAASMLLVACSPMSDTRGHVAATADIGAIKPGATNKDGVLKLLGSPSSVSSFGPETWYYISARKERKAFFEPKIVEQKVTGVEFDEGGLVREVHGYDEKDARDIAAVKRTTPTEGHTLGFVEQIVGNIGRFNKPVEEK